MEGEPVVLPSFTSSHERVHLPLYSCFLGFHRLMAALIHHVCCVCVCGQVVSGRSAIGCSTTRGNMADGGVEKGCGHCGAGSTLVWRRTGRSRHPLQRVRHQLSSTHSLTLCVRACVYGTIGGLKYTKTLQQAQQRKGRTGGTLGAVPLFRKTASDA